MIGKLIGRVDSFYDDTVILDVHGVGYAVTCSAQTLRRLSKDDPVTSLLIETRIAEDRFDLFGFLEEAERRWYKELIKINGVSAKIALAVLSVLSPPQLSTAIAAQDKTAFKQVSGVGPKLATRLITELKDKAPALQTDDSMKIMTVQNAPSASEDNRVNDALSALVNLGYNRSEAYGAVNTILQNQPDASVSQLIKDTLKMLSRELT